MITVPIGFLVVVGMIILHNREGKTMKYVLAAFVAFSIGMMAAMWSTPANGASIKYAGPYTATVERVIDGDTVVANINLFPSLYARLSVRIHGIDTPESTKRYSKCEKERLKGIEAKTFVKSLFSSNAVRRVYLTNVKFGKYAGRVLADLSFKMNGETYDLKDLLIERGYGRAYYGRKKSDWCN